MIMVTVGRDRDNTWVITAGTRRLHKHYTSSKTASTRALAIAVAQAISNEQPVLLKTPLHGSWKLTLDPATYPSDFIRFE